MANGRIERMTPREEFLVEMFNDDPRLVEMFRQAERKRARRWYHRVDWFKLVVWIGLAIFLWVFWWGVARGL